MPTESLTLTLKRGPHPITNPNSNATLTVKPGPNLTLKPSLSHKINPAMSESYTQAPRHFGTSAEVSYRWDTC